MSGAVFVWVIYKNPLDYPGRFVVRKQKSEDGQIFISGHCFVVPDLETARGKVPYGMICIGRQPDDDKAIYEVWI